MEQYEIPSTEDLITPERLAKGDLEVSKNHRGRIRRAIPVNLPIIKELIGLEVFPHSYELYGVSFLELRAAFRAPWAPKSCAVLLEQWGIGVSASKANEIYQNVCRALGLRRIGDIEYVLEQSMKIVEGITEDTPIVKKYPYIGNWEEAFERLAEVMDSEREKARAWMNPE